MNSTLISDVKDARGARRGFSASGASSDTQTKLFQEASTSWHLTPRWEALVWSISSRWDNNTLTTKGVIVTTKGKFTLRRVSSLSGFTIFASELGIRDILLMRIYRSAPLTFFCKLHWMFESAAESSSFFIFSWKLIFKFIPSWKSQLITYNAAYQSSLTWKALKLRQMIIYHLLQYFGHVFNGSKQYSFSIIY